MEWQYTSVLTRSRKTRWYIIFCVCSCSKHSYKFKVHSNWELLGLLGLSNLYAYFCTHYTPCREKIIPHSVKTLCNCKETHLDCGVLSLYFYIAVFDYHCGVSLKTLCWLDTTVLSNFDDMAAWPTLLAKCCTAKQWSIVLNTSINTRFYQLKPWCPN